MKPARLPASSRPKPCASLKKPHDFCPLTAPCWPSQKENRPRSEISFSLRYFPVRAFDSRAQGFSPPVVRRRSSCPSTSPNLVRTLPTRKSATRLSATVFPAFRVPPHLPKGTRLELGRGAHLGAPSSINHTAASSQQTAESRRPPVGCISRG